jgi:hypothetical protein
LLWCRSADACDVHSGRFTSMSSDTGVAERMALSIAEAGS